MDERTQSPNKKADEISRTNTSSKEHSLNSRPSGTAHSIDTSVTSHSPTISERQYSTRRAADISQKPEDTKTAMHEQKQEMERNAAEDREEDDKSLKAEDKRTAFHENTQAMGKYSAEHRAGYTSSRAEDTKSAVHEHEQAIERNAADHREEDDKLLKTEDKRTAFHENTQAMENISADFRADDKPQRAEDKRTAVHEHTQAMGKYSPEDRKGYTSPRAEDTKTAVHEHEQAMMMTDRRQKTDEIFKIIPTWRTKKYKEEVQFVAKEFVLSIKEVPYGEVFLNICYQKIHMKKIHDNLFGQIVHIAADYPEGLPYIYERNVKRVFSSSHESSDTFYFDSRCIFRDCWGQKEISFGIQQHKKDIFNKHTISDDAIKEIKTLPLRNIDLEIARSFLDTILCEFDESTGNEKLFNLYLTLHFLAEQKVNNQKFGKELKKYSRKNGQNIDTVSQLVKYLCFETFDCHERLMAYMFYAFTFLGELELLQALKEVRYRAKVHVNGKNIKFVLWLIKELECSKSFDMIKEIIKTIPFDLLSATYGSSLEEQSEISDTLRVSMENETLNRTEQKLQMSMLGTAKQENWFKILTTVQKSVKTLEQFRHLFERSFEELIRSQTVIDEAMFNKVIKDRTLFLTAESKELLVDAVIDSKVNSQLFECLAQFQEYNETMRCLDPSKFEAWYHNCNETGKGTSKKDLRHVCRRLNQILSLHVNADRREVVEKVRKMLLFELNKRSIGTLLKEADTFDKHNKNGILLETFKEQVSIEVKNSKDDVLKLLKPFIIEGVLKIETRCIADIICMIFDKYNNEYEQVSQEQYFSKVIKLRGLIITLFKSKGQCRSRIEEHPFYISIQKFCTYLLEKVSAMEIDYKLMLQIKERKNDIAEILIYLESLKMYYN